MALLLQFLQACRGGAGVPDYFPLEAGHRWTYRVQTQLDDGSPPEQEVLRIASLGAQRLAVLGDAEAWWRQGDAGVDYWLRRDESGIYRVASKSLVDEQPKADQPVRYVLKAPFVVGSSWQADTTAYLLMRSNEFPREIRHVHPHILMTYQISATAVALATPAGQFKNCLVVSGLATLRLYADPATGWRDQPLRSKEWYCPGVGLARLERSEPAHTAFLRGGERVLELEAYE
ncbi:hypothetical protein DBR47_02880 [Paucibacter sp. KBW04]|nr:hypothetical protein DBR47_02880 [Paucibacter sp. KBW04]